MKRGEPQPGATEQHITHCDSLIADRPCFDTAIRAAITPLAIVLCFAAPAVSKPGTTAHPPLRRTAPEIVNSPQLQPAHPLEALPITGPFPGAPHGDRLLFFDPPPEFAAGTLIYAENDYISGSSTYTPRRALVFRQGNSRKPVVRSFYCTLGPFLWDPQSLTGNRVLIRYGDFPDTIRTASFGYYILNADTGRILQGAPFGFRWPRALLSPDHHSLAFVLGGDAFGGVLDERVAFGALVYNIHSGAYRTHSTALYFPSVVWSPQGTLLLSGPPPAALAGRRDPAIRGVMGSNPIPSVFEWESKGTPSLLIRNAEFPTPLPSGRRILFWGWPDSSEAVNRKVDPAVQGNGYFSCYVYDRVTKKRTVVVPGLMDKDDILIPVPDGKRMLVLRRQQMVDNRSAAHFYFVHYDEKKQALLLDQKPLAVIEAKDVRSISYGEPFPQFRPLHFSEDGAWLYVYKREGSGIAPANYYLFHNTLEAVNIDTGRVVDLAELDDDFGMDWIDGPGTSTHALATR